MSNQQHIRVVQEKDYVTLVCDDYELYDWMEDLFTEEHSIEIEYMRELSETGMYQLIFPNSVTVEFVRKTIDSLDPVEVERVYLLNNSKIDD